MLKKTVFVPVMMASLASLLALADDDGSQVFPKCDRVTEAHLANLSALPSGEVAKLIELFTDAGIDGPNVAYDLHQVFRKVMPDRNQTLTRVLRGEVMLPTPIQMLDELRCLVFVALTEKK